MMQPQQIAQTNTASAPLLLASFMTFLPKMRAQNARSIPSFYGCAIGKTIIFCSGSFFLLSSSTSFFLAYFQRHRLDVYHTSTHGAALVRITEFRMHV